MADTAKIQAIARETAEEVVKAHMDGCTGIAVVKSSLDSLSASMEAGFDRLSDEIKDQRKDLGRSASASARHSERIKALERKKSKNDEASSIAPAFFSASTPAAHPAVDADEKWLVSPKILNAAVMALVVAVATAAGSWAFDRFIRAAPAVAPQAAEPAKQSALDAAKSPALTSKNSAAMVRTP